ncbi:hypothetical protein NLX78_07890 [Paenibacillus sp. Lou8.1]|nr:hypothetical protein [Paenibacillus sp. Lou8.1]
MGLRDQIVGCECLIEQKGLGIKMTKDYRQLLLEYGYPEDLVDGWTLEDCQAEWQEFCGTCISE